MVRGSCPVCHPSGGVSLVLQSLVGARWSSSGHPKCVFSFLNALFVLALVSTRRFGYSMLGFSVALFLGAGWVVLCFRHGLCDDVLRPLPCSSVCGLHCTSPTMRDNRNGRMLYPVRVVRCSWSAWAAHRQRCEPFMLPQVVARRMDRRSQSPSGSRCLGHGSAGSRSRNGLFCVPWARCTCAVAPYLLCEELAVIPVDGCGCGARAHPLLGFCFGTVVPWFLATFYRFCGWWCGTWVDPVLLAWTYHCFRLGAWSLGLASSSVACHPSPSHGLAWLGVRVGLHFLKCCLYYFLEILDLIS